MLTATRDACSRKHIAVLVRFYWNNQMSQPSSQAAADATTLLKMSWQASGADTKAIAALQPFTPQEIRHAPKLSPIQATRLCVSLQQQARSAPDWASSAARDVADRILHCSLALLPGWTTAPWTLAD